MTMSESKAPKKFVNLHGHSLSIGDSIGTPKEHMDFARENGLDALAITDHGHNNAFSHQYLYQGELDKKGVDFKSLYGNEAYFIDSLADWTKMYQAEQGKKEAESKAKKKKKSEKQIGENALPHIEDLEEIEETKIDEDTEGGTVIEVEDESKSKKFDPLKKRNHLVLLAKNDYGLRSLFKCTSLSYINGFYRYPRMDFDMLKENAQGNVIALSACVGGPLASIIYDHQVFDENTRLMDVGPNFNDFEIIQEKLKEKVERFQDTFGEENFYLELQWNKLPVQHLVNMHLLECSKRTGANLVVTCDSHYARPEHWREREIYKAMAQLQFMKNPEAANNIPKTIDELKCELYPKNADQIWKSYKETSAKYDFYNDDIVREAIERTWDIAHHQIEKVKYDTSIKLPSLTKIISKEDLSKLEKELGGIGNEDDAAFAQLKKEVIKGAKWRKVDELDEYISRLREELLIIRELKTSKYFLTYAKIMNEVSKKMLTGPGRGSGAASLVCYVLNITQIDPIKNNLLLYRFISKHKKGMPDIDSDSSDRDAALKVIIETFGEENVIAISNFTQLQARSLIKDICRLNNVPFEEVNKYTNKIEHEVLAEAKKIPGFDAQQYVITQEELEDKSPSFRELVKKYPEIETSFKILFKQFRGTSKHAGGVLITDNAPENMPVIKCGGNLQTPWSEGLNFRHLEPLGFLKFDILSIGTLKVFENTIKRILHKQGKKYVTFDMINEFYYKNLHPDNNKMDDMKVYENVYHNANYIGIFQFVNPQVQNFTKKFKPSSIEDLAVITSVFRPGPLCLSGNTQILLRRQKFGKNHRHFVYKTIKQLYDEWETPVAHGRYNFNICSFDENNKTIVDNNPIKAIYKSGIKKVYSIVVQTSLEGSKKTFNTKETTLRQPIKPLFSTEDHMFLTLEGWKPLKNLVSGDYLFLHNTQKANKNKNTKRAKGEKNFKNIAFDNYKYECLFCDWNAGSLDTNHISENRKSNNKPENLCFLCPNHHRQYTEKTITEKEILEARKLKELINNQDVRMVRFLDKEYIGEEETYDIEMEAPHHNFFAGGVVVHNSVGADKIIIKNKLNPDAIIYKHPLLKDVFGSTYGLLVYQEQLQEIYNKLAGTPIDQTDSVRKAFTKKDISNKEKTMLQIKALRDEFISKCKESNGIDESLSGEIFDDVEKFVSYSFNKAHAVSYATVSYMCAWLFTYFPNEWVASYIDYCIDGKGKAVGGEDPKAVAFSEAKALGYRLSKPDINKSGKNIEIEDKNIIPSFESLKGVGSVAVQEIYNFRPYKSVEDLLWIGESWKHSKFNKRALETIVCLEALDSLEIVGEDKLFKNYKQLHYVIVENNDKLKRAISKKKKDNKEVFERLIQEAQEIPDWTIEEKIKFSQELTGTIDIDLIVTPDVRKYFYKTGVRSIDRWDDDGQLYWAVVDNCTVKQTSGGKKYLRMSVYGDSMEKMTCNIWNFNERQGRIVPQNTLIIAKFKKNDFGLSTTYGQLEVLERS